MEKEFWLEKWENHDIAFNQSAPNNWLQRYLSHFQLPEKARVFVPLCGKSIDMLWLVEQGYEVIGVEVSQTACEDFFRENNIEPTINHQDDFIVYKNEKGNITLFCGDFFKVHKRYLGDIQFIYDRAALIALPRPLRFDYTKHMARLINLHTKILLITITYDEACMNGPPFSVNKNEVLCLYEQHFTIELLNHASIQPAPHLQKKGLRDADEQIYALTYSKL